MRRTPQILLGLFILLLWMMLNYSQAGGNEKSEVRGKVMKKPIAREKNELQDYPNSYKKGINEYDDDKNSVKEERRDEKYEKDEDEYNEDEDNNEDDDEEENESKEDSPHRKSEKKKSESPRIKYLPRIPKLDEIPFYDPDEAEIRKCPRYLLGYPNHSARLGHYFDVWYTSWAMAHFYNLTFLHREPFYPRMPEADERFGFAKGEVSVTSICESPEDIKAVSHHSYCKNFKKDLKFVKIEEHTLLTIDDPNSEFYRIYMEYKDDCNIVYELSWNQNVACRMVFREVLRKRYEIATQKNPLKINIDPHGVNVAMHLRRGDVASSPKLRNSQRWTETSEYVVVAKLIISFLKETGITEDSIHFHILSQGKRSDFPELEELKNLNFHLDEDLYLTVHYMVKSDIFVGSRSSFPIIGGVLSPGVKLFHSQGHSRYELVDHDEWVPLGEGGLFEKDLFLETWLKYVKKSRKDTL